MEIFGNDYRLIIEALAIRNNDLVVNKSLAKLKSNVDTRLNENKITRNEPLKNLKRYNTEDNMINEANNNVNTIEDAKYENDF